MNKSKCRRERRSRKNIFFHLNRERDLVDLPINFVNSNVQACRISLNEMQHNTDFELKVCSNR